ASFSGCRQYHEDVARARVALESDPTAPPGPTAERLPHYFDRPGFVQANAEALAAALAGLPADLRDGARLVATAHSIPDAMAVARAATAGTRPAFVASLRELVEERRAGAAPQLGTNCPAACCFVRRPSRP